MDIGDIFDPANAVIPFFLKPAEDSSDKEYRLCVIRNSRYNSGTDSEDCKNVYIYIGNIFDSIESISFLSDCEKLVMQEIESELKKVKYKANTTVISDNFTEAVLTKDIEDVPDTTDRVRSFNVPKMTNTHTRKQRNSRLFSGKYDSMKQRYMLMRDNREYNYRCYNNSLRYEMLLCGKLTLTDSQFYDGMLFTEMIEHGHFVDFIKCSYKHDTLEIRRRCNQNEKKDFIKKIYGKSFYYSSIKSYELAKRIESAGEALWNHPEKEKYCETIDTYWDFMKSSLPVNSYNEEITNMKKWYAYFDSIYEDMFVPWGKLKDVTFDGNYYSFLTEDNAFCEAIEIANKLNSIPGADINRYTSFIIAKCRCSKSEFLDIKDFRTTIVEGQTQEIRARIKAVNIEDTQKEYANKLCNDLIKTFNYSYNRVIAMQHDCKFLDSISKDNGFEGHDHNDDITIKFDENSLNYISNCSWSEFEALLDDVYVDEARNNLYKLIDDIADEREIDVNCFTNALNNLNDAIRRYCEDCNIISGDKLNSIYNADAKTTDYFGTERFARQGGSKRFIGHGSNLVGSLSNDLCIFAPNTNDGEKMFRIYFDETPDNEYDTIICPTNYKEGK